MMRWNDCVEGNKVKEVQKNPERARSLVTLAERRIASLESREDEYPQLLLEDYYEVIKELTTALLALQGYKSYSHECLISFLREYHENLLSESQLHLIDELRELRSDILYRGRDVADDYLVRNLESVEKIIQTLLNKVKEELE